jgi:outer membrane murein-binding lipoprotein Lpp
LRLLKLANWLSKGDLDKYKQQAQQAQQNQAQLAKIESELERVRNAYQATQKELAQAKAQLQINQGFQIELGETQLKLKKMEAEATRYKKELFEQTKELSLSRSQLRQVQQTLAKSQNWTQQIKTPIQVTDISKTLAKQNFDTLWGFGIITPKVNSTTTTGAILVKGWVLGKKAEAQTLRVIYQTELLLETPVQDPRPMVMQQYPDISTAKNSGFEFSLAVAGISTPTQLNLEAVLVDQTIVPLCALTLTSQSMETEKT